MGAALSLAVVAATCLGLLAPIAAGSGPVEGYVTGIGDRAVELWLGPERPAYASGFREERVFADGSSRIPVIDGVARIGDDPGPGATGTIEGTVRAPSLGGPLADALACAQREDGSLVGCVLTDSDGTYTLSEVPPGEYTVQFGAAQNVFNLLNQFYDHAGITFEDADFFELAAGETRAGIDADLEEGGEISGTVYSAETGEPVPGVVVCTLFFERFIDAWFPRVCTATEIDGTYAHFGLFHAGHKVAFSPEFKEFFGEEVFEGEDDGFDRSFFDDALNLDDAEMLLIDPPDVLAGIDGHLRRTGAPPEE